MRKGRLVIVTDRQYDAIDLMEYDEERRYKFLTASVIPRPIALVTSLNGDLVLNAAPFSQYVIISVSPPLLGIVSHETPSGEKDTVRNIIKSGEYVINAVSEGMAEQVQECAIPYPHDVSEVEKAGLSVVPSMRIKPARIAESLLQFECRLHSYINFGNEGSRTILIVGEVLVVHCAQGVVEGHRVLHDKLKALGRIAGRSYCKTGDILNV